MDPRSTRLGVLPCVIQMGGAWGAPKNVGFAVPFESSCSVDGASCMMVSLTCVVAYRYGAGAR